MEQQGAEYSLTPAVTSVNTTGVADVPRRPRPRSGVIGPAFSVVEETSGDD